MKATNEDSRVAYEKYLEAAQAKKEDLARVYLLNAITHDPRIEYLREYVGLLLKAKREEAAELLPQAYNLLSLAALNGPASEVEEVQGLIAKLQALEEYPNVGTSGQQDEAESMETELEELTWQRMKEDGSIDSCEALTTKLANIKQALESGLLDEKRAMQLALELQQTQWQIDFVTVRASIADVLKRVEEEVKLSFVPQQKITALMGQATNLMAQIWTLKAEGPLDEHQLWEEQDRLQKRFSEVEERAQEVISRGAYAKIIEKIRQIKEEKESVENERLTPHIDAIQERVGEIQELLPSVVYAGMRKNVQAQLKMVGDQLALMNRRRYAKYQSKMAEYALGAIKSFDDMTVPFEKDAEKILSDWSLERVDESLLSPEAAGLFQSAKSMLTAKLSVVKRANFDFRCVTADKYKLENF